MPNNLPADYRVNFRWQQTNYKFDFNSLKLPKESAIDRGLEDAAVAI